MFRIVPVCLFLVGVALNCSITFAQQEPSGPLDPDPTFVPNPERPRDYLELGNQWLQKQNYDKAIETYTQAIAADNTMLDAYFNRGYAWRMKEQFDQAMSDYNAVLLDDPKDVDALNNRAIVWCLKGNLYEALQDFDRALAIDPKNGQVARNKERLVKDRENFQKLVDHGGVPELEEAYVRYGEESRESETMRR